MKIYSLLPYITLISVLLADLLLYGGLVHIFFDGDKTIIAGIIAFVGTIIAGFITYLGVNKGLEHRDREVFLSDATEKLMNMEVFKDKYSDYLNAAFISEQIIKNGPENKIAHEAIKLKAKRLISELKLDKEKMYKSMEYEQIEILNSQQKSLDFLTRKKEFTEKDALDCIERIRDVFQVLIVSKEKLELKYRQYKKSD